MEAELEKAQPDKQQGMKAQLRKAIPAMLALLSLNAAAVTRYVDLNSPSPTPPYTNWLTAATNIQDAIESAVTGDLVFVTNGVYQTGGKTVVGIPTINRVAVEKAIVVASVNGPDVTTIKGIVTGRSPIRCVYLTNGAVLVGFTLTNGVAGEQGSGAGGGVYCQSAVATVTNCTLSGNSAVLGGGAYQGTLINCILRSNSASAGGGAYQATLNNCALIANSASSGGGVSQSTLNNCTLTGNVASSQGGGSTNSTLNNCIVYYNIALSGSNYSGGLLNFCCTTPLPGGGSGNFTNESQFASAFHISVTSPCRGAGNAAYASGTDIDGEPWENPPSVGCDEYRIGHVTGPLGVSIAASYTNFTPGFSAGFTGTITGKVSANVWDFGDGVQASNLLYVSHAWGSGGTYPVVLTAYNEDYPGGISATQNVQVADQIIFYVAQDSTNPVAPYTNWATAAQDIQSALDVAVLPGQWVLVSNGVYQTGGRLVANTTNRVAVQRAMRLASVNGPDVTIIEGKRGAGGWIGAGAVRCVYLASGAVLEGFTLRNGATETFSSGGGVYCQFGATVTNCILHQNYAYFGGGTFSGTLESCVLELNQSSVDGGGAYQSKINNSTLYYNIAGTDGGGASSCTVNDCLLTENYAIGNGGGARFSTLNNCILDHNRAEYGGGSYSGTANNCIYTNNYAYSSGGGIYYGTVNSCLLIGNGAGDPIYSNTGGGAAYYGALNSCRIVINDGGWNGGGTYNSTVNNCIFTGNSALYGGGANGGTLRNCTVTGNSGFFAGGGVMQCTLYNSIVCYNTQAGGTNNYAGANAFTYCCTTPDPGSGSGNITNEPVFVNAAAGDLHLQSNSPCINSGNNSFVPANADLDGNPRIVGGTVDIGAYEFQSPSSVLSYAWAQQYGLNTDGSSDFADGDGDCSSNWQEWRADTNPTNALSVLRMVTATNTASGLNVTWQSVSTRSYSLERATDLGNAPSFQTIATNIAGASGTKTYTDTSATNGGPFFYRVGVQ